MKALLLEKKEELFIRDINITEILGPHDVRIKIHTVGICGSDIQYYRYGAIGPFIVHEPMILGHEASGTIIEVGSDVKFLKPGDRVCMEPGIPDPNSKAVRLGIYNLDPSIKFWATPPVHGIIRESVVHPEIFTYRLPNNITYAEGAMVEPLAIGIHAANKAQIKPGDVAVVIGAGTIGIVTALAAIAGGCSRIIIADIKQDKLDIASKLGPITTVNSQEENLTDVVKALTDDWGADIIFEASGNEKVASTLFDPLCPGGHVVYIGMPGKPVSIDIVSAQAKEARLDTIFRYANVFSRALLLMETRKIDLKPLITETYKFKDCIRAFNYSCKPKPSSIKVQIII